jgi:hypothetical protein
VATVSAAAAMPTNSKFDTRMKIPPDDVLWRVADFAATLQSHRYLGKRRIVAASASVPIPKFAHLCGAL